jgi:glycosyltransferase involved in cell wall biosynthesis
VTLAIVSSRYPRPGYEAFLETELRGLARHFDRILVLPARDALFTPATLADALRTACANPGKTLRILRTLLFGGARPVIVAKNLAVLPRALAISRIVAAQGVDHIHAYWLSAPATVAYVVAEICGIPWSASAHRWDIYERNLLEPKARSARFFRTISRRGQRDLGMALAENARKVAHVKLGVEMPKLGARRSAATLRILCAANLIEQKGHAVLLDALASLARRGIDFRCEIAGSGPLQQTLQKRILELGLSARVAMLGRVPHDALLERLRSGEFDVAVLASRSDGRANMEGIPVALIEAMAASVPCVATGSGSVGELIDARSGIVVAVDDVQGFAAALERLAQDPDLRRRLGENARRRVAEEFNLERTAAQLAGLIVAS